MKIDTDKYEGHTPADQWTIYKMGADKPYHAVRFGQRGLDLELEFGADAQLIADAPDLLAEILRLREDNKKLHDAINGCAYANMQGSALDLYCESIIERCPTCYQNIGDTGAWCGCEEE